MKVKPLKYKLSQSALRSVTNNAENTSSKFVEDIKQNPKRRSLVLVKQEPTPSLEFVVSLVQKNELFAGTVPLPSSLFYAQAKEFSKQVDRLVSLFPNNVSMRMVADESEIKIVHEELYSTFLIYKISSITSLISFVECFVNALIPETFTTTNSKNKIVSKEEIERFWSLKDKLKTIVPQIFEINDKAKYESQYNKFLKINNLRNEFIHMKSTRDRKNMEPFIDHFTDLVNLNLEKSFKDIEKLIELIQPDYFQ